LEPAAVAAMAPAAPIPFKNDRLELSFQFMIFLPRFLENTQQQK
jgi:hypothetical protein